MGGSSGQDGTNEIGHPFDADGPIGARRTAGDERDVGGDGNPRPRLGPGPSGRGTSVRRLERLG